MQDARSIADRRQDLAVDLDGVLVRGDRRAEALLRVMFESPLSLIDYLDQPDAERAVWLSRKAPADAAALAYDEDVLGRVRAARGEGRTVVLVTRGDAALGNAVAAHLGLFDTVAADSIELLDMERVAKPRRSLATHARALLKAMRPQQWAKNVLAFAPMIAGGGWGLASAWIGAFAAFWALSFTASAVYLVNDAADIEADRKHPRKRRRPFASGDLSPALGLSAAAVLMCVGLTIAASAQVFWLVGAYLAATTAYSLWLKRKVLVDVFLLAGLYAIRLVIGGAASDYFPSDWLLAFSCFFFFSLALVKRVDETLDMKARGGEGENRRGYRVDDASVLTMMGVASGLVAALVLALYLQQNTMLAARFNAPIALWVLPAAEMFWICRIWLKTMRGEMHDDPIIYAVRDRVSWGVGVVAAAGFVAALLWPEA